MKKKGLFRWRGKTEGGGGSSAAKGVWGRRGSIGNIYPAALDKTKWRNRGNGGYKVGTHSKRGGKSIGGGEK